MIGAGVYNGCGQTKKAIARIEEMLRIVPNDPGWFINGLLVKFLYEEYQDYEKIHTVIGEKIDIKDMNSMVLAIYSILEYDRGNQAEAIKYFKRAKENGFLKARLQFRTDPELTERTHKTFEKIESLVSG